MGVFDQQSARDLQSVVVPLTQWRPDPVDVGKIEPVDGYGGVGRKP